MNNRERAEKIFSLFIAEPSYRDIAGEHQQILNTIASQLDEAVREAREVKIRDEYDLVDGLREKAFTEGFASAREKAAKTAEEWKVCDSAKAAYFQSPPQVAERISEAIRGMTNEA